MGLVNSLIMGLAGMTSFQIQTVLMTWNFFVPHNEAAEYFEHQAKMIDAPAETDVEVKNIVKIKSKKGFTVKTSQGKVISMIRSMSINVK